MALANLALFGGSFFTPILVGKITHTIGWPWSFYFVAIFTGVCLPLVFFGVPETTFQRSAHLNSDLASSDDIPITGNPNGPSQDASLYQGGEAAAPVQEKHSTAKVGPRYSTHATNGAGIRKKSRTEQLHPLSSRKSSENFFKLLVRPFPLFLHPAVFWACLTQGAMIGWTVFIGIILAAIFLGPPLFWSEVETGYAYTGAFLGAVLGFLTAGFLADWSTKRWTARNGGIFEPEFRLVLVVPQLILGCTGLFGFGITAARIVDYSWVLPVFFFALEVMGMVIGTVASALYILDAHRKTEEHYYN